MNPINDKIIDIIPNIRLDWRGEIKNLLFTYLINTRNIEYISAWIKLIKLANISSFLTFKHIGIFNIIHAIIEIIRDKYWCLYKFSFSINLENNGIKRIK